jgi:Amt family ammonium transporter
MSYLKYGYVFLCVIFLVGLPLTSWSQDAVPEGEPTLELAEGESENVSTEEAYEVEDQSPEELDHEAQQILDLKQAVAAAANAGHNGWMLVCCALVLFMTAPGLALFYGGLVRKKNVVSVLMQCLFLMGLMSVVWAVCGYSFAFGGNGSSHPFIGSTEYLFLEGVSMTDGVLATKDSIAELTFALFQGMFFIITPALICGAFAERMKFSTMAVFSVIWGIVVYCPICHWVWDGGIIGHGEGAWAGGALDFAGGTVVHISSGVSALVACVLIGKRMGFGSEPMPPHNLTYTVLGAAMLWVGWFGFNAGSQLAVDDVTVTAFAVTHLSAAAGVIGWTLFEWAVHKKPTALGAASGAVAGLVCITPAAGFVQPMHAILMGFIAGALCFFAVTTMKSKLGYDDSLDAFGVHGIGGTIGAVLTGVFATSQVNTGYGDALGIIDGNYKLIVGQVVAVLVTVVYAGVVSFIILKVLDKTMGLRVDDDAETRGLDLSEHGEEGYIWL